MPDDADETPHPPERISSVQRALEEHVANPLFRVVLRSRLHWLASRWLVLVSYAGRRTGRRYTFPVAYASGDGAIAVVTPKGDANWWKNFRDSRRCTLWLRGTERPATGELLAGDERETTLIEYLDSHEILGRLLGVDDPTATPARRARAMDDLAVVRFTLVHG